MISRPKFSWGRSGVQLAINSRSWPGLSPSQEHVAKVAGRVMAQDLNLSRWLPGWLDGSLSISRVARLLPYGTASLLYAVAKWLCQKSRHLLFERALEWISEQPALPASLISVLAERAGPRRS